LSQRGKYGQALPKALALMPGPFLFLRPNEQPAPINRIDWADDLALSDIAAR
jgi:hypothetical protein